MDTVEDLLNKLDSLIQTQYLEQGTAGMQYIIPWDLMDKLETTLSNLRRELSHDSLRWSEAVDVGWRHGAEWMKKQAARLARAGGCSCNVANCEHDETGDHIAIEIDKLPIPVMPVEEP